MFRSKFTFLQVYLTLIFIFLFIAIGIFFFLHPNMLVKTKFGNEFPGAFVGLTIFAIAGWMFFATYKWIVIVEIEPELIMLSSLFSKRLLSISEISSIDLIGRESIGVMNRNQNTDVVIITLASNEKIIIPDIFYSNSEQLKYTLSEVFKKVIVENTSLSAMDNQSSSLYATTDSEKFAGNPFTSLNGLLILGFVLFCLILSVKFYATGRAATMILPALFIYFLYGWQMHYFIIEDNCLIIRNHVFPWVNKKIPLADIQECVIESPPKRSNTLKIILKSFTTKNYSAGTLRDDTWKQLIGRLQNSHVSVINEVIQ